MKQKEITKASTTELQEQLVEARKAYSELKMAHAISPLENPVQIRSQRRIISRIATELTNREVQ